MQLEHWQLQELEELWFHLDGSSDGVDTGAAVTLWARGDDWQWGGALQHSFHEAPDAYHAEVAAHILALKLGPRLAEDG